MPELPEVETIKKGLERALVGARITGVAATVKTLRLPIRLERLQEGCVGRTITRLRRRAKFIVVVFDNGRGLLLHLGMTGAFQVVPAEVPPGKHDRVVWTLADGRQWRFMDTRRFGSVCFCETDVAPADPPALAHLGPEPLESAFDAEYLYALSRNRSRPVKSLLMDQKMVVGIGNIYANEALFRAGVAPGRRSRCLGRRSCGALVCAIKTVLAEAIEAGGTTISDFQSVTGEEGKFRTRLEVYGRHGKPCPRCGAPIRREVLAGRSTFYCSRCQK
jgi:formamidopyrimidine-DNA glycosylase